MENALELIEFGNDTEHLAALEAAVVACLPTFPVLRAQLQQTVTQVEQAAVEVCEGFHGMVARARESVNQTTESLSGGIVGNKPESGSQALVVVTQGMLARTEAACELTRHTVLTMEQVEVQMVRVAKSLQDIEGIAAMLKFLGLNASIEASRAGEYGKTFGVVASETKNLAGAAAQISKSVQEMVEQLRKNVDDTSQRLRTVSTALSNDAQTSRTEVDQAVGVMIATEENLRRSVEQSSRSSESLAENIARAVVAMQFQDSMSQQVAHVVETLGEVEAGLSKFVSPHAANVPNGGQNVNGALAEKIMSRYTMQSERDIHLAHLGLQITSTDHQSNNVELF